MRYAAVLVLAGLLAGCGSVPAVKMVHPDGRVATCGPYSASDGVREANAVAMQSQCIHDFQRQGFERAT